MSGDLAARLEALDKAATPGPWEVDHEADEITRSHDYYVGAAINGKWQTLFDTVNSDYKLIDEDRDGDGGMAWDVIGEANTALIVAIRNALPEIIASLRNADALDAAQRENEKLRSALDGVMVGGNHLALLIGADHPPYTAKPDEALAHYGACDAYEAWCCWRSIMRARAILEGKTS